MTQALARDSVVAVIGSGAMGAGIAQVAAASGHQVLVYDTRPEAAGKAIADIGKVYARLVEKGRMDAAEADLARARLVAVPALGDVAAAALVIEAIVENLDEKRAIYQAVEAAVRPEAIIASNTSSLCITELASTTKRPDRFGGLHFFNPVPLMKLVEVIPALTTSEETQQALTSFATSLGKEPIAAPDRPGFIVNRLLVPYLLDAIREYERGLGTIEDIDKGMKLGCGYPMGPFTLLDFVGLDTTYYIANIMFEEFREPRFAPPPLLKRMVLAGYHGRKTKRGFYTY